MGQNRLGGLYRGGGDQRALRLGVELLIGQMQSSGWDASGHKLLWDSRVGAELGGSGRGSGLSWMTASDGQQEEDTLGGRLKPQASASLAVKCCTYLAGCC